MLGFEFENNSEPFSVFNLTQALATFMFELVEVYVDTYPRYVVYTIVTGVIGFAACGATYFFDFKNGGVPHKYS